MFYFIHIFYHLKDEFTEVCVSYKRYNQEVEYCEYDFYSGKYASKSIHIIEKYDKKLLKHIEERED